MVEWIALGVLLTVLGGLIRFRGWTFLIAGYDESSPIPAETVQNAGGNTIMRTGIVLIVAGVLTVRGNPPASLGPFVGAIIAVDVFRLIYRLHSWTAASA